MFKRLEKNTDNEYSVPAKRPKYDVTRRALMRPSTSHGDAVVTGKKKSDDVWGDDFADEDIEEMDFVASQACIQEENIYSQTNIQKEISFGQKSGSIASTSRAHCSKIPEKELSNAPTHTQQVNIDRWKKQDLREMSNIISQPNYNDFENKLMHNRVHNSTFKLEEKIIESGDSLKEFEKLKLENKKLLNDFITKEGEAAFLRKQLQQAQSRAQNDQLEKARIIEEQTNRFKTEINTISREKEQLKTQLELQTFEVGNLMERCKLLEGGNVKLIEPHVVHVNSPANKSKFNSTLNRLPTSVKPVKVKEICIQTDACRKSDYCLKTWSPYYPFYKIPKLLYDTPQPEKSVVDIQITEKTGRRNLPILQEEETFRIFENPELVKPVITMIDDRKLTAEFILPEVAALQKKTDLDLESESSIPMINKLAATAREMILNVVTVLQTIFRAMRNDDIRDMNDIYFSDLYSNPDINAKSMCDANAWHENERGVEARRVLGALSYVTAESTYLSKYIAGKTELLTERDESYKRYSKQMIRYDTWSEKGHEFEMLEMILQFVVLVGSTRRSHQFSGLMCAIALVTYNVQHKVGYCPRGMEYVFKIFREIVFSRPLPYTYSLLSNVMTLFVKSPTYLRKLCVNSQATAVKNWKDTLHFTPDACPLQIFLAQMQNYQSDLIATIDITHSLLTFTQYVLQTNVIPLISESSGSCNCCIQLVRFTIKALCRCSEENLSAVEHIDRNYSVASSDTCILRKICGKHSAYEGDVHEKCLHEIYRDKFSNGNSWSSTKRKQFEVWRAGIRFFCHLAICDPDFVSRFSDIEDSFHSFMRNISISDDFVLNENEREAISRVKQTFVFDKPQSDVELYQGGNMANQLNILSNFETSVIQPESESSWKKQNYSKTLTTIKSLLHV